MLTRTAPLLALVLLTLTACSESYTDDPTIDLSLPYDETLFIGVEVLVDIKSEGCESGVREVVFDQQNRVVTRVSVRRDLAPTRVAVSTKNLDLSGQVAYPAQVSLTARLVCRGGAEAKSGPVAFELLPAAKRVGELGTLWPSYEFWPQSDGTVLFCGDNALQRLDQDGSVLSVSAPLLNCSPSVMLERHADLLIVHDREDIAVFDKGLDIRLQTTAKAFDIQGDTIALIEEESDEPGGPLSVRAVSLSTGAPLWESRLDEPDMDWLMTAPHVDPETEAVYLMTVSVSASPLEPRFVVWRLDAQSAEAPERVHTGDPTVISNTLGDVFVVPSGDLLSRTRVIITEPGVQGGNIGGSTVVKVLDMSQNTILWSREIEGQAQIHDMGSRRIVASRESMLRIGEDGQLEAEWTAPAGRQLFLEALSPHGEVILTLRNEAGVDGSMTMLDGVWSEVWTVPYNYASGAAFDEDGGAWWHSAELLRLHTADDYRLRIQ